MASSIEGAEFQMALGRILAEPDLNERFLADPRGVGGELGLDGEQIAALEHAGLARLRSFAHSLWSKRIGLLKKICPATYELVEQRGRLAELAGRFVREHPPREAREHSSRTIRDGFWLIDFLLRLEETGELGDPLLAEVARFERAMLEVTARVEAVESAARFQEAAGEKPEMTREEMLAARPRRGVHCRVEVFTVDIVEVIRALGEGRPPEDPSPGESIVLFSKMPGRRNVRYATVNAQTRQLLELCDGVATCREIIARMLRLSLVDKDPEAYAESCLGLLTRLAQINAVTFDRAEP
jgi:hypothetical protein